MIRVISARSIACPSTATSPHRGGLRSDNFETAIESQNYMRRRSATDKNPVRIDFDPEELVKR